MNKLIFILVLLLFGLYIHMAQDVKTNPNGIKTIQESEVTREVFIYNVKPKKTKGIVFGRISKGE